MGILVPHEFRLSLLVVKVPVFEQLT